MDINSFQLYLFSPKIEPNHPQTDLHNQAYDLWQSVWTQEFERIGSELKPDHFLRQDIIPVVAYQNEVVAMHLYTLFNILSHSTLKNPYFSGFKKESLDHFRENGLLSLMGMEYLTVNKKFRKSITGFPFGEIMIGLATKIMSESRIDACIGTARTDIGIEKMVQKYKGYIVEPDIKRYNLETALICITQKIFVSHPDSQVSQLLDLLWHRKINYTYYLNHKKAA